MSSKITIGIAVYNPSISYFEDQIKSIISQTLKPNKVIFIDDFSENFQDIEETIENLMSNSDIKYRIYRNKKNMGVNFTFRRSYQYFDNGLCFLSDQDDIWHETKIEEIKNFFTDKKEPLLVINDCNFYIDGKINNKLTKFDVVKKITGSDRNFVAGCCTCIDSRILKYVEAGLFNYLNYDDQLHEIANLLKSRIIFKKSLQLYRRHNNNVSQSIGNFVPKKICFLRSILKQIEHILKELIFYRFQSLNMFDLEQTIKSLKNEQFSSEIEIIKLRENLQLIYDYRLQKNFYFFIKSFLSRKFLTIFFILTGFLIRKSIQKYRKIAY